MFKIGLTTLFLSANIYIFIRGWQAMPNNSTLRFLYSGIFLLILVSVGLSFCLIGNHIAKIRCLSMYIRGYWEFLLVFFLLAAFLADTLRAFNYFFPINPVWIINNYTQLKLNFFLAVLSISIIISIVGFRQFSKLHTVDLNLLINKDESRIEDINVVAASDMHIGDYIRKERLTYWIAEINRLNPDIVLFGGDIFDRSLNSSDSQDIINELRKLKSKYGVFAVLGNQEYYSSAKRSIEYLEQAGITPLRDQTVIVDNRMVIIGRDDASNNKRKKIDELIKGVDNSLPVIMMDHQPYDLVEAVRNNIDLYLSGHTHNGQIFPGNIFAKLEYDLVYGHRRTGNSHFYVSSGLGINYIPIRLGTQSEIVRISMKGNI